MHSISEIATTAEEQFGTLREIDGAGELLAEHDHTFEFDVNEDGRIVIDIREGEVSIEEDLSSGHASSDGESPVVISAEAETIHGILAGETTIVDEVWKNNAQAPVYGASMYYTSWISRILKAIRKGSVDR